MAKPSLKTKRKMSFMSFCLKNEFFVFYVFLSQIRILSSACNNIIMCSPVFLSTLWKTCVFFSKKFGKCLEGIGKSCTFALAFQNYGTRLRLRATRKSSLRRLHTTESSTRSDSYTLLYIGLRNWVEETNRSILGLKTGRLQ